MKLFKFLSFVFVLALSFIGFIKVSAGTLTEGNVITNYDAYRISNPLHTTFNMEARRLYIDGKLAYCIEPEVLALAGDGYESSESMTPKMNLITAIAADLGAETNDLSWVAAQRMLHNEVGGEWSSSTAIPLSSISAQMNAINNKIKEWETKPSFDGQTVIVKYGESVTLTDTNNVLSGYSSVKVNTGNVKYLITGNQLKITPSDNGKDNGVIGIERPSKYGTPLIWKKANSQTILTQGDPTRARFSINLKIILMGKSQIKKVDAETGKPMPGVKFKMTVDGKDYDVTTNDKGIGFIDKEFLQDTEVTYREVKTLDGYVLNDTPIKGKIKAGETITLSMNNDTQKGRVKGHKEKEVYNPAESEKQGKSVYDKVPLPNVTFDVVAQNDITRPDGEIVLKKGETADTFTTNENADFESAKDLYIGAQNTYKLVERDVPDNYRPLYDKQATFTIPYDAENKTKVFTLDMGPLDNDLKTGTFDLNKVDSKTGKIIPNTQFLLRGLSAYNKDVLYTITTGDKATLDKLIAGKYEIVEVKYADGHTANATETGTKIIEIKDNETTKVTIKNDTIDVKNPKVTIKTKAHLENGSQEFTRGDVVALYDDVDISHDDILDGTQRSFETILVARTPDGKETDIWKSGKIDYKVSDSKFAKTVVTEKVDTAKYPENTTFYFKETGYDDKGKKDTEHNFDGKDEKQSIVPKKDDTPKPNLPMTGETKAKFAGFAGLILVAGVAIFVKRKSIVKLVSRFK